MTGTKLKKWAAACALWLVWAALVFLSLRNAALVAGWYPAPSLRYRTGLGADAADTARTAAAQSNTETLWPTFWSERTESSETDRASATLNAIWFDGDAGLIQPASFIAGGYPGPMQRGAAVSAGLAWQLWGSQNAVGMLLNINGEEYEITGVYDSEEYEAMLSIPGGAPQGGWQGIELAGSTGGDARAAAESFVGISGLPQPDSIVCGGALAALAKMGAWLSPALLLMYGLVRLFGFLRPRRGAKTLLLFGGLLLFALALPALLGAMPGWLVPSRWSDFSHWNSLAAGALAQLKEYLLMPRAQRDAAAALLLLRQGVLVCGALVVTPLIAHRLPKKQLTAAKITVLTGGAEDTNPLSLPAEA